MATKTDINKLETEAHTFAKGIDRDLFCFDGAASCINNMMTKDVDQFASNLAELGLLGRELKSDSADAWMPIIKQGEDIHRRWRKAVKGLIAESVKNPEDTEGTAETDAIAKRKVRIQTTLQFIQESTDEEFAEVFAAIAHRIRPGKKS